MNLRWIACALCILSSAALLRAQTAQDKQNAKQLFERASSETGAKQATDLCSAKKLDPNNKEYSKDCEAAEDALRRSDNKQMQLVESDFTSSDWASTISDARYVSSYFPEIRGHADELVARAKGKQDAANHPAQPPQQTPAQVDPSQGLFDRVQADWKSNNFDDALIAAKGITSQTWISAAQPTVTNITNYQKLMADAKAKEQSSDYEGARAQYISAANLKPDGPGEPTAQAQRLLQTIEAKKQPPPPPAPAQPPPPTQVATANPTPKPTAIPKPQDDSAKVATLLAEAQRAETDGKLPFALARFQAILAIQLGNPDAMAGVARVQQKISSDPQQLKLTLVEAIRDFYDSKLPDAKAALGFYLNTPQARSAGAAFFYLGATLVAQSRLDPSQTKQAGTSVPPEALADFQKARAAGYKPLPQYVSPVLMKAWNSAGS
jgi:hypothetical protein